jgi:bifunctional non-homologous end joining protein LigD
VHEVKFDGYRLQISKAGSDVTLYSRNGSDWTDRLPRLAAALSSLACSSVVVDAELVAVDDADGIDFAALDTQMRRRQEEGLVVWVFDLIQLDGEDLRALPYVDRKARLARLVQRSRIGPLYLSEALADGDRLLAEGSRRGLDGIVSKRRDSVYRSGKSSTWLKVNCAAWREANRDRHALFERTSRLRVES